METIIQRSTKKNFKLLLVNIFLLVISLVIIYTMLFVSQRIYIYLLGIFCVISVGSTIGIYISAKRYLQKDKTGLILNEEGLVFRIAPAIKKIGLIRWNDIESTYSTNFMRTQCVFLRMKDLNKYVQNGLSKQTIAHFEKNGIPINSDELEISFTEMESLIIKYLKKYQQN